MTADETPLRTPDRRRCERCGRREAWDGTTHTWRVRRDADGDPEEGAVGNPYCVHEWDIDGDDGFVPFVDRRAVEGTARERD